LSLFKNEVIIKNIKMIIIEEKEKKREKKIWPLFWRVFFVFLTFVFLAVFFLHGANALNQDLGRHLKLGQIIWQTKSVPNTNFFSWTEPDYPFINHHWLSEVIFYGLYNLGGIKILIVLTTLLALLSFFLIFLSLGHNQKRYFLLLGVVSILSIGLLSERTDIRPEVFGFLGVAFFWWILIKNKERLRWSFWLLLPAQLLWVNLHITFCFGLIIYFFFFLDRLWARRRQVYLLARREKKIDLFIALAALQGFFLLAISFLNPNTWRGVLYPLTIFRNYGYTIVENQSPFFLEKLMVNPSITIFKITIALLILSFILNFRKISFFNLANAVFFGVLSWKAIRHFPFLGLISLPVLVDNFYQFCESKNIIWRIWERLKIRKFFNFLTGIAIFVILIGGIYGVVSNQYFLRYQKGDYFGLGIPAGFSKATDFLIEQKITGRMFNNFDIGGYLIWRLFPEWRVFVDNRPEAYSKDFFQSFYIPMQNDPVVWRQLADEVYKIDFIFFAHTDATPWAENFLRYLATDKNWQLVYVDSSAAIWVKNNERFSSLIENFRLDREKIEANLENYLTDQDQRQLMSLALFWEKMGWLDLAIKTQERAWEKWPHSAKAALFLGNLYSQKENWSEAQKYFLTAIKLDKKWILPYELLGQTYYLQGNFSEARRIWENALKINPDNEKVKSYLDSMGLIPFVK